MGLFFFILDLVVINAFIISRQLFKKTKEPPLTQQRAFRMRLAWNLIVLGARELDEDWTSKLRRGMSQPRYKGSYRSGVIPTGNTPQARSKGYVAKNFQLPLIRFAPGTHELVRMVEGNQQSCTFCRYKRSALGLVGHIKRTRYCCQIYGPNFPLCPNYKQEWHAGP